MQIVINVDNELYEYFSKRRSMHNDGYFSHVGKLIKALRDGTIFPKGHGRLIDVDYLKEDFKASKKISFAERMDISCIVDHAPTIIKADREGEIYAD